VRIDVHFNGSSAGQHDYHDRVVLVIDVLRASTSMAAALANGARAVIPFEGVDEAITRARALERSDKRTLFERIVDFVSHGPDSKDELIRTLADAENRELIEPESRLMLEGVLRMADMTAADVMVAAPRMDLLDIESDYDDLLNTVIETGHSRFPVYDGGRDNIIGILMAKD